MKKGKNHSKQKIEELRCQDLLESTKKDLEQWSSSIKRTIKSEADKLDLNIPHNSKKEHILNYLSAFAEFMNIDRFDAESPYHYNPELTIKSEKSPKAIFLNSGLFNISKERDLVVSISLKGLASIKKIQLLQSLEKVIINLLIYSKGFIPLNSPLEISLNQVSRSAFGQIRYFSNEIENNIIALYSVGYEKIPAYNQTSKEVEYFLLDFCVQLEEILTFEQHEENQAGKIKQFIDGLEADKEHQERYRYVFQNWAVDEGKNKPGVEHFSWNSKHSDFDKVRKIEVIPFKHKQCTKFEALQALFRREQEQFHNNCQTKYQMSMKEEIEPYYQQSQINYIRAKEYVRFISEIPNFKFKLTRQQEEVLGKNGNLIVIGRSGTGKTLLSILRLYAIQYLCKSSTVYRGMREGKLLKKCIHHYMNQCFEEKNVFLTASPYLIEQIMKQYKDMHCHLQKQHKKDCLQCQQLLQIGLQLEGDEINLEALLERIERRDNICSSVSGLNKELFPQFFTVKSVITIIDQGLQRPFFDIKGTLAQKDTQRKVINIYWENTYRIYQLYEEHLKMIFKNRLKFYTNVELNEMRQENKTLVTMEIDYKIFSQTIWKEISSKYFKTMKKQRSKLNASVVWAQIFSIIKGSVKAHTTHLKCLSPAMYLQESKSAFLNSEQKMDIYYLFQEYEKYKIYNKSYDMMDVVNHILQEVMLGRYKDEAFDYMFIDEVQDLTPAAIYLLTKMTKKDVFYCGDTAQAISKGVTFKFSEIKSLFSPKYFKHCITKEITQKEQQLTVNFRSHNRILQLANTVVEMIKELFPNTIDVMESERSDLFGPKPILIDNGDERIIYDLLLSFNTSSPEEQQKTRQKILLEVLHKTPKKQKEEKIITKPINKGKKMIRDKKVRENTEKIQGEDENEVFDDDRFEDEELEKYQMDEEQSENDYEDEGQDENEINAENEAKSDLLYGLQVDQQKFLQKATDLMNRQLSSDQVILVRNIDEKNRLPCFLSKQYTLTAEQVKGLQYQDIIIYNFFESSPCREKWSLLDNLDIIPRQVDPKEFESRISRRLVEQGRKSEAPELDEETMIELGYNRQKNKYEVLTLERGSNYAKIDIKQFHQISSQLKIFYTLVTRAKNTVIIFDRKVPRQLMKIFNKLDIVRPIKAEQIAAKQQEIKSYKEREGEVRYLNKNQVWEQQAIKQLVRENYDEAIKCFQRAGNINGSKRVKAMKIQKQINFELFRIEAQFQNPEKLPKEEFKMKKNKLKKLQKDLFQKLGQAGDFYEEIKMFLKAGQIYVRINDYERAIQCFKQTNSIGEIAQSFFKLENYQSALENFKKVGNISRIIDCYIKLEQWDQVFSLMKKNTQELKRKLNEPDSDKFRQNIKLCLKEMLDHILEDPSIQSDRRLNESFANQKEIEQQRKARVDFMVSTTNEVTNRLGSINNDYNIYLFKIIVQNLHKEQEKNVSLQQSLEDLRKQQQKLKEQEKGVTEQSNKLDKEIRSLQKQFSKKKKIISIEDTESKEYQAVSNQLKNKQKRFSALEKQLNVIHQSLGSLPSEIKKLENIWKQRISFYLPQEMDKDLTSYQVSLQNFQRWTKNLQQQEVIMQQELSYNPNYSQIRNQVYQIMLGDHSIKAVIEKTLSILDISTSLLHSKIFSPLSFFDHRKLRRNTEETITKRLQLITPLQIYNSLETLNCSSLRYVLCDYFGLKHHIHWLVLQDILQYSRNFYQKRKIKEVSNVLINKQENERILHDNENILNKLGATSFQTRIQRHATKQCTFFEPMIRSVIQGLILQGFYQNCLIYCEQSEKYKLTNLFMNYDALLEFNLQSAKEKRRQKMKEEMKYYFFKTQGRVSKQNSDNKYLSLINIYSIQKIFFDFDKCQENPILSKKLQPNEIELNDYQIQKCEEEAEESLANKKFEVNQWEQDKRNLIEQRNVINRNYHELLTHIIDELNRKNKQILSISQQWKQITKEGGQLFKKINIQDYTRSHIYQNLNQILIDRFQQEKILEQMDDQYEQFKMEGSSTLSEDQFKSKLQNMKINLQKENQQLNYFVEQQQKMRRIFSQSSKELQNLNFRAKNNTQKEAQLKLVIKKLQYECKNLERQKIIYEKQKSVEISEVEKQIRSKTQNILKWTKMSSQELERQIRRIVLQKKKKKNVDFMNEQSRLEIKKNIQKHSNLNTIDQLKLLDHLIKKEINIHFLTKNVAKSELLLNIFKSIDDIENKEKVVLSNEKICLIIIIYLSFLFNGNFRNTLIQFFMHLKTQMQMRYKDFDQFKVNISVLESRIKNQNQQIQRVNKKMQIPENKKDPIKMKNLIKEKNQYFSEIQTMNIQYHQLHEYAQKSGLKLLAQDPMNHVHKLLSVYSKIKNVTDSSQNFLEIFLGFFQCRIIKHCNTLSFLQNEYVFVQADSIILKKMVEENQLTFGHYFDCHNRIILTTFTDVHRAILSYLQKQHLKIYEKVAQLNKFQKQNNEMLKMVSQTKYMEKKLLGGFIHDQNQIFDSKVFKSLKFINYFKEEPTKLFEDYQRNKLLLDARSLKREVLDFYLREELKQKENFFFTLYQIREYQNVEDMLKGKRFFNPKSLKEIQLKLRELEESKNEWMQKERYNYDPLPCKLNQ